MPTDPAFSSFAVEDFYMPGDTRIHGWLQEAVREGEMVNQADPSFALMDESIAAVMGENSVRDTPSPNYLRDVNINLVKDAIRKHVSGLTDLKPMFAWKTENTQFTDTANVLNLYSVIWWVNTCADMELADVLRYGLVGGCGDAVIEYDPHFMGGETRMTARDPRDTLPIRPTQDRSPQHWEGVTIREAHTVNKLRGRYPELARLFVPDSGAIPTARAKYARAHRLATPVEPVMTLSGLGDRDPNRRGSSALGVIPTCTLYRTFINDRSRNMLPDAVLMGRPGTAYSYMVQPGALLYPNKRLVLWVENGVIYDGPSPYASGLYPLARLKPDPWPWSFLGLPIMADLVQANRAINYVTNDLLGLLSQTVNRGSIWDKQTPAGIRKRFDPREPNWKITKSNPFSKGVELSEVPMAPTWALEFLRTMNMKFDELAGTANLGQLLQLRQVPGKETIDRYTEALTAQMRLEARQIEVFLRDVAQMVKSNLFQYQTQARRYTLLGDAGRTVDELDWDPDKLVPAMAPGEPGYVPQLDASVPDYERAKFFATQFSFHVAPGSLLSLQAQERKLLYLQLARVGYLDFWTLMDMLEIPNAGSPPPMPMPAKGVDMSQLPPGTPPPMEVRVPHTITERLLAQAQLGIGMTTNPAGRKATGQEMPHIEQKDGGTRQTVSES